MNGTLNAKEKGQWNKGIMNLMATIQKETIKVWFLLNQGKP